MLSIMSKDFKVSIWEVGTWTLKAEFRAYHQAEQLFYLKDLNLDEISEEFDVAVLTLNDDASFLVSGLYNGVI